MTDIRFPRVVTETLAGSPLVLPDSLDADRAIVIFAFRRHAQVIVDSWLTPLRFHLGERTDVKVYEIPVLSGGWRMVSGFIDGGMRSGIPAHRHDTVATYYGDVHRFRTALNMHDLDSAYAFLISGDGSVLWRASGWATKRSLQEVESLIA